MKNAVYLKAFRRQVVPRPYWREPDNGLPDSHTLDAVLLPLMQRPVATLLQAF
jgi:hypothetical protein